MGELTGKGAGGRAVVLSALVVLALGAALLARDSSDASAACGSTLAPLTPSGEGAAAYTMGLRVNQPSDVDELESAIGGRVLGRDVFAVNTEYDGSGPDQWRESVERIRDRFPCNRIATLNGLGSDSSKPGYAYALVGTDGVDAVLLDWETDTWEAAGLGAWDGSLAVNLGRISERFRELSERAKSEGMSMGIVPDYLPGWDYGRIARVLALLNWRIDSEFRGYQLVQTQPNCGSPAAPGPLIGPLAKELRDQYRPLLDLTPGPEGWVKASQPSEMLLQHLGFEIAFSTSPNPKAAEAVDRIGPEQAASCSEQVLAGGGAGILYWADAASLKAMLETDAGRRMRPTGD